MTEARAVSRRGNDGSRATVSIKEVARLAGVSIATVSRCLNSPEKVTEPTRLRVKTAVDETGYSPNTLAQNFRRGKTNLVMVVVPSVGDPFFADIMNGIHAAAATTGYSVFIEETHLNPTTAEKDGAELVARQADGVILLCNVPEEAGGFLQRSNQTKLPVIVGFDASSPQLTDYASVYIDNAAAAFKATRHLIDLGHERVAMISGTEQLGLTIDRESGYRSAMQEAGVAVEDGWVVDGRLSIDGARHATRQLLENPRRPTAIFCATDEMAFGCMHEIKQSGWRIPHDISVVGFDNTRYAEVADPPLTTVSQPTERIGRRAMQLLCAAIEDRENRPISSEILPFELVIRGSTSRPGC